MKVPFNDLKTQNDFIKSDLEEAFKRTVENSTFILGPEVRLFEKEYAKFNQTKEAVGVSSGLDALVLCLQALEIGLGDEVIVPSNTYIASVFAITKVGATPIFVEPNKETYNLDATKIEQAISSRTKAIMPVHLYGQACEMTEISRIAKQHKLFVVEDNAQAQGAFFDGKITGSWGDINATSFYPGKNIGALGDAGGITSNDTALVQKVKTLRNYGSNEKYVNEIVGNSNRMDTMQAAFLSVKLKSLNSWNALRKSAAALYLENLKEINGLVLPKTHPKASHVYHLFVVRTAKRDALQAHLKTDGVDTLIHYPIPPHLQQAYEHLRYAEGDFPIAEELARTCLSLPMFPGITKSQINHVSNSIKKFFELG